MTRLVAALRGTAGSPFARVVLANCSARVLAILGLAAATIAVARVGGPSDVGGYALLRMLPGLVGVLAVGGLPGALGYFLSEPRRRTPGLWPTLLAILAGGSVLGVVVWLAFSPLLASTFFPGTSVAVIAWAAATWSSRPWSWRSCPATWCRCCSAWTAPPRWSSVSPRRTCWSRSRRGAGWSAASGASAPVSYTHLTLPTN